LFCYLNPAHAVPSIMSDAQLSFWRDAYNSAKGKPVQQLIRTAYTCWGLSVRDAAAVVRCCCLLLT
jgi:hypothetical protein